LAESGDVIPILLSRFQLELPLDLHDETSQVVIDDFKVMDEIRVKRK
jgi:hypothetical protein